jgi:tetratricopeptide (TPR) repeat protein
LAQTLDALEELTLHSLLEISFTEKEVSRYTMLSVVHEFAQEKLDSSAREQAQRRHAEYFREVSSRLSDLRQTDTWQLLRDTIVEEIENFRSAIQFAQQATQNDLIFDLMRHLVVPYFELGYWQDASQLLEATGEAVFEDVQKRVRYLGLRGAMLRRRGAEIAAQGAWEEQCQLYQSMGDIAGMVDVVFDLAGQAIDRKQYDRAEALITQGTADAKTNRLAQKIVISHVLWSRLYEAKGEAQLAYDEALQAANLLDEWLAENRTGLQWIPYIGIHLPPAFRGVGKLGEALRILRIAMEIAYAHSHPFLIARLLDEYAPTLTAKGNFQDALEAYFVAQEIHKELHSRYRESSRFAYNEALKTFPKDTPSPPEISWRERIDSLCQRLMRYG